MKSKAQNPSRGGVKVKPGGRGGGCVFGTSAAVVDRRCWIHQKIRFLPKKKNQNDEGDADLSRENLDRFGSLTHLCRCHQRSPLGERLFDLRSMTWKGQDSARAARNLRVFSRWDHVTRPPGSSGGVLADAPQRPDSVQEEIAPDWGVSLPQGTTSGLIQAWRSSSRTPSAVA